jgi:hypothetical protein
MAMACLRFFTGCFPERMCFISVSTSLPALGLYRRLLDFFLLDFVLLRLELDLLLLDRFFELDFFFEPLFVAINYSPFLFETYEGERGLAAEVRYGGIKPSNQNG